MIKIKYEFNTEYLIITENLIAIKAIIQCDKIKLELNDDGSGKILTYDKKKGLAFTTYKTFKNFDELINIFSSLS